MLNYYIQIYRQEPLTITKQTNDSSTSKTNPHCQLRSRNYAETRTGNRNVKPRCRILGNNLPFKYRPLFKMVFDQNMTALIESISTIFLFSFSFFYFLAEVFAINNYFIKQMLFQIGGKFQISSWPINHKNLKILNFRSIVPCAGEAERLL